MNLVNTVNGKFSPPSVSPRAARAAAMLVKSLQLRFQAQHLLAVEDLDGMVDGLHCLTSPGGDKHARLIEIQKGTGELSSPPGADVNASAKRHPDRRTTNSGQPLAVEVVEVFPDIAIRFSAPLVRGGESNSSLLTF